jgi:periplasmic protein TonB
MKIFKMKKTLFTLLIIATSYTIYGQNQQGEKVIVEEIREEQPKEEDKRVFSFVQQKPEFPGGDKALFKYIADNINYPKEAKINGIEGTVVVKFVVKSDGSLTKIKIARGIGGGCDEETVRLINAMPKWIPGKNNGKVVNVSYSLPVKFKL